MALKIDNSKKLVDFDLYIEDITDKGIVIDDVFAKHVDDVLPILKEKFDLKVVSSFIIRQITNK